MMHHFSAVIPEAVEMVAVTVCGLTGLVAE